MSRPFASPVPADYAAKVAAFATSPAGLALTAAGWVRDAYGPTVLTYRKDCAGYIWLMSSDTENEFDFGRVFVTRNTLADCEYMDCLVDGATLEDAIAAVPPHHTK